jgi:hypothetical protein
MSTEDMKHADGPYVLSDDAWQAYLSAMESADGTADRTREAVQAAARVQLQALQARVENYGVRGAREQNWCAEFSRVMFRMFPDGPLDGDAWRDDEGYDCRGNKWVDADGYDRAGFNGDGYDRDGYDRDGLDRSGFNREGVDANGVHRDAPERYRFNAGGWDRQGFNADGTVFYGLTRELLAEWADADDSVFSYDRSGYGQDGFKANGFDRQGYDRDGYNTRGYNRDGYNREGWHRQTLIHRDTGTRYNPEGWNAYGEHAETGGYYGPDGYDRNGVTASGRRRPVTTDA